MKEEMVEIQYYYTTENGKVYENRSVDGGEWEKVLTPYDKPPYILIKRIPKQEFLLLEEEK